MRNRSFSQLGLERTPRWCVLVAVALASSGLVFAFSGCKELGRQGEGAAAVRRWRLVWPLTEQFKTIGQFPFDSFSLALRSTDVNSVPGTTGSGIPEKFRSILGK